jgi:hypothetical protein
LDSKLTLRTFPPGARFSTAAAAGSVAVIGLRPRSAHAAAGSRPHLTENTDPLAGSFADQPSAQAVNRANRSPDTPGERCARWCRFFPGKAGEAADYAGCATYLGDAVSAQGWGDSSRCAQLSLDGRRCGTVTLDAALPGWYKGRLLRTGQDRLRQVFDL